MNLATLQLETPRLLLRPTLREDFEPWAAFMADPESARFVGGVQPRSVAWRGFLSMAGAWAVQGFAMFSVIEKASARWIGRIGPWQPEGWPGTEIGWGIVRDRCGLGYATEAATATIDWAFAELGWTDVIHTIDVDNVSSQAVAHKLGSRNRGRGRLPAPYSELVIDVWGQTKAEWLTHRHDAPRVG
jgi:RimJ/RimL family protein N-acetyltransferase